MRWLFGGGSLRERLGDGLSTEEQRRVREYRDQQLQERSVDNSPVRMAGVSDNMPLTAPNVQDPLVRTEEDIAVRSQVPLKA